MQTSTLQALVHSYIEAFDKADITIIEAMFAPNASVEDPVGTEPKTGIAAIKAFYQSAFDMGVKLQLDGLPRCAGNSVAFAFRIVMGDMKLSPIDVFEVNEAGQIVRMRAYWGPENMG